MALLVIAAGKVAVPLAFVMYILLFGVAAATQQWTTLFFFLIATLILGDSRQLSLMYWYDIRFIGIFFVTIFSIYFISSGKIKFQKNYLYIILFASIAIVSAIRGPITGTALFKTVSYLLINFITLHYIVYLKKYDPLFLKKIAYFLFSLIALGFILIPVARNVVWFMGINRYNGIWGNPNGLGLSVFLNTLIFYYYTSTIENKTLKDKIFHIVYYSLSILSIFLSASRGGLISTILFLTLFSWQKARTWIKVSSVVFVIPVIIFFSNPDNLLNVANSLGLSEKFRLENAKDGGGRFIAWNIATSHMNETIIIGKGIDYDVHLFKDYLEYFLAMGHEGNVHNSFITLILTVGGLGLFGVLLYYGKLISNMQNKKYAFSLVVACSFSAFFESWLSGSLNPYLIIFLTAIIIATDTSDENPVSIH